ncbi:MAG: hypothetical protein J0L92_15530 [Deltaproteobacteria bacterium]|nr:hypothetical protein [Deltaproteobacteria bacterium]
MRSSRAAPRPPMLVLAGALVLASACGDADRIPVPSPAPAPALATLDETQPPTLERSSLCSADAPPLPRVDRVTSTDVAFLRRAERFAIVSAGMGDPRGAETAAFRRVLASDDAIAGFLDLVVHGTTAGRLYGLAGVRERDPERFVALACAVRPLLGPRVSVREACVVPDRDPWELVESVGADVIRSEPHWDEQTWSDALEHGELDLVGGSLSRVLALGRPHDRAIEHAAWIAGSDGLAGLQPTVASSPDVVGAAAVLGAGAEAVRGSLECVLDAGGRRTCSYDPQAAREAVRERCAVVIPPGVITRRYDDGPWRRLFVRDGHTCGVAVDDTVWCFAMDRDDVPASAGDAVIGPGQAWRVDGDAAPLP